MQILLFKSLHIIGFVAWFAGLFYLVRLFVYHREADKLPEAERTVLQRQYLRMQWRLYRIITTPAMVFTLVAGMLMLCANPAYLSQGWLQVKLVLVGGLVFYHHRCKRIIRQLESGSGSLSAFQYRLFNELPTLLLVGIVLLAVFRSLLDFGIGLTVLVLLGALLFLSARWYKRYRLKRGE